MSLCSPIERQLQQKRGRGIRLVHKSYTHAICKHTQQHRIYERAGACELYYAYIYNVVVLIYYYYCARDLCTTARVSSTPAKNLHDNKVSQFRDAHTTVSSDWRRRREYDFWYHKNGPRPSVGDRTFNVAYRRRRKCHGFCGGILQNRTYVNVRIQGS